MIKDQPLVSLIAVVYTGARFIEGTIRSILAQQEVTLDPAVAGQVYNLGSVERINFPDLANLLVELNGVGAVSLMTFPPERKAIDIGDYCGKFDRISAELGWQPAIALREGLARTLAHYKAHLEHYV